MPLYQYKCNACGTVFEKRLPMGSTEPVTCECGQPATKLISSPAIVMNWRDSDSVHESKRFREAVLNPTAQKEALSG